MTEQLRSAWETAKEEVPPFWREYRWVICGAAILLSALALASALT